MLKIAQEIIDARALATPGEWDDQPASVEWKLNRANNADFMRKAANHAASLAQDYIRLQSELEDRTKTLHAVMDHGVPSAFYEGSPEHKLQMQIDRLGIENAELKAALEFYAKRSNWQFTEQLPRPHIGIVRMEICNSDRDIGLLRQGRNDDVGGRRAREALAKYDGGSK